MIVGEEPVWESQIDCETLRDIVARVGVLQVEQLRGFLRHQHDIFDALDPGASISHVVGAVEP